MPTTSLMPQPKLQFLSALGTPLVGGKLYTFAAGTSNPKPTFTDAAGTTPQENPITLNLRGEPPSAIFWSGNYRVELRDLLGNLIYSVDNYRDPASVVDSIIAGFQLTDYAALRAYTGTQKSVFLTGYLVAATPSPIAGMFVLDSSDNASADNGGTIIVDAQGRRWKRVYSGMIDSAWFGAAPSNTGAANGAAMQAAVNAGAPNQDVLVHGVIRCSGVLNITRPTSLVGVDPRNANLPDYNTSASHLIFTSAGSGGGIVGNQNLSLRNLVLTSAGDYAVSLTDASLLTENVVIQGGTSQGIRIIRGYYNKFTNTRLEYAGGLGAYFDNCYNISASGLSVRGVSAGLLLINGSTMTMHAGSIEDFGGLGYGIFLQGGSQINLFGTYFEGNPAGGGSRGVSLDAGCSVSAIGCHVYANTMARWITAESGASTGVRVYARNNKLVLPSDGFAVDVYSLLNTDATGYCDIAGDNWQADAGPNARYVGALFTSGTGPVQNVGNYRIEYPAAHPLHGKNIDTNPWCANVSNSTPAAPMSGTMVNFGNNGVAGDDPIGLHTGAWYYAPYMAIYQKGQWEKVGLRLPNQANTAGATLAQLETELNTLKTNLRAAGVMV